MYYAGAAGPARTAIQDDSFTLLLRPLRGVLALAARWLHLRIAALWTYFGFVPTTAAAVTLLSACAFRLRGHEAPWQAALAAGGWTLALAAGAGLLLFAALQVRRLARRI